MRILTPEEQATKNITEALWICIYALCESSNVQEFPANGKTQQDQAIKVGLEVLNKLQDVNMDKLKVFYPDAFSNNKQRLIEWIIKNNQSHPRVL